MLEVADNGKGFDRDTNRDEGGIGLDSLVEHTEIPGGTLTNFSKPVISSCLIIDKGEYFNEGPLKTIPNHHFFCPDIHH